MAEASIIVHGGAGRFHEAELPEAHKGCERAAQAGYNVLRQGGSALDAVTVAVQALESHPLFDAGTGSYPTAEGEVEMDAIIVDGATGDFGAVAALRNAAHPIAVARRIMEKTPHALLVGEGAGRFAQKQGFPFVPTAQLQTQRPPAEAKGTVGAVAVDQARHVAAGTSTGGMRGQMLGRVGDSALIGCGALAEDAAGGVSATGHGEAIMRVMLAGDACGRLRNGMAPRQAARASIAHLKARTGSTGGLILLDDKGRHGLAHTTPHMAWAQIGTGGAESGMVCPDGPAA